MRWLILLCAVTAIAAVHTTTSDLRQVDDFNQFIQLRFQTPGLAPKPGSFIIEASHRLLEPDPRALGMSRMVRPISFGQAFLPDFSVTRDFEPENSAEKDALTALETAPLQVGLYLFGRAILNTGPDVRNYRALKGPAAVTQGAPRPKWYPTGLNPAAQPDALPDWQAIYPLAQRAMKSFADGGAGFETAMGTWNIAARPVVASQDRCIACHNSNALHQTLGGVIYAYRRNPA